MSNPESDPGINTQPSQEELAGLSPEQLQRMIAEGLIDPTMLPRPGMYDEFGVSPASPYSKTFGQIPANSETRDLLQANLVAAESRALNKANQNDKPSDLATYFAVEKAVKDKGADDARKKIESIFGGEATRIEQTATTEAIEMSSVSSTNKDQIARAVAAGESPIKQLERETDSSETVVPYAELKDKVNGRASSIVEKIAVRSREKLKSYGVRGTTIKKLGSEALKSGGADLTKNESAEAAIDETIGTEVIRSLVGGRPKMTKELREQLKGLSSKPGELAVLARAVASSRHGGGVSHGTLRLVGKRFRRTQQTEKAA